MKLLPVIDRIKQECAATFSTRVAGAAQWAEAVEQANLAVPHAFVIWLGEQPTDNESFAGVVQDIEDQVGVVVAVSNTVDDRGQAAQEALDDVRTALLAGLLGWNPSINHSPLEYRGSAHLAADRSRIWHQFAFASQIFTQSD